TRLLAIRSELYRERSMLVGQREDLSHRDSELLPQTPKIDRRPMFGDAPAFEPLKVHATEGDPAVGRSDLEKRAHVIAVERPSPCDAITVDHQRIDRDLEAREGTMDRERSRLEGVFAGELCS